MSGPQGRFEKSELFTLISPYWHG